MLNMQTPETTEATRWIVTRPLLPEDVSPDASPWVLVAETGAGRESQRCWMQVQEAVKSRMHRVVTFTNKDAATEAVADGILRWGLDFVPTPPRAVEITQTTHHEYKTFDVVEVFDAVGAP